MSLTRSQKSALIGLLSLGGLWGAFSSKQEMQKRAFLEEAAYSAMAVQVMSGVPASVVVAQAAIESNWGRSYLAKNANNYFGIKADARWAGKSLVRDDWEFYAGRWVNHPSKWRVYDSREASFLDHADFFYANPRYARALGCRADPVCFAIEIHKAGYATDPEYSGKLRSLIEGRLLRAVDVPAKHWRLLPRYCRPADRKAGRCAAKDYGIEEAKRMVRDYLESVGKER